MKENPINLRRATRYLVAITALASIPLTALALSDYYGSFYHYVSVGNNMTPYYSSSSSSTGGNLMVGYYNSISSSTPVTNALVVGSFNIAFDSDSAVIGRYNKNTMEDELFILGNGANASNPSNALEVLKNGTIRILRQGDISMGAYGN